MGRLLDDLYVKWVAKSQNWLSASLPLLPLPSVLAKYLVLKDTGFSASRVEVQGSSISLSLGWSFHCMGEMNTHTGEHPGHCKVPCKCKVWLFITHYPYRCLLLSLRGSEEVFWLPHLALASSHWNAGNRGSIVCHPGILLGSPPFSNWEGAVIPPAEPHWGEEATLHTPSGFFEVSGLVPKHPQRTVHFLSESWGFLIMQQQKQSLSMLWKSDFFVATWSFPSSISAGKHTEH